MVRIVRPANLLIMGFTMMIFWFLMIQPVLINNGVQPSIHNLEFTLLMIMVMLIAGAGYVINDIYDLRSDSVNKPERPIGNSISIEQARKLYFILNALALVGAFYLTYKTQNFNIVAICAGCTLLLWLYSKILKSTVLLGNVIVSLLIGGVPFIFVITESQALGELQLTAAGVHSSVYIDILGFTIFAFMTNLIREIVKDCEDFEGDLRTGTITIATGLGFKKADYFSISLTVILLLLTYLYARLSNLGHYPIEQIAFPILIWVPLIILLYYLITKERKKPKYTFLSRFLKGIMFFGLLYLMIHFRLTYA